MSRLLGILSVFRKKSSIERALLNEGISRRPWQTIPAHDLIEALAAQNRVEPNELLSRVSNYLSLPAQNIIETPSRDLLNLTGHRSELLRSLSIIPQPASSATSKYSIVIADPDCIAIEDFLEQGIKVYLGLGSQIETAWSNFFTAQALPQSCNSATTIIKDVKKLAQDITFTILNTLLEQAAQCHATEVFIGHPDETQYEFIVNSSHYRGKIKPQLYGSLVSLFSTGERRVGIPTSSKLISNIYISLTRNGTRPVILASWDLLQPKHQSSDLTKKISNKELAGELKDKQEFICPNTEQTSTELAKTTKPADLQNNLQSEPSGTEPIDKKTLLLIDDNDRFRLILRRILESKGWEVVDLASAISALDHIKNNLANIPQIIICDVHMPHMNGIEFLQSVKKFAYSTPILMLTSDDNSLLQAELALLGADAFVRKQDDPRVLLAWCYNLRTKRKSASESK